MLRLIIIITSLLLTSCITQKIRCYSQPEDDDCQETEDYLCQAP